MSTLALPAPSAVTLKALVVDDIEEVRQAYGWFLRGCGMEVFHAENGAVALDAAARIMPDVVVTDIEMPVMNGLDFCQQLRRNPAMDHVVVVAVTGAGGDDADILAAGCDAVLSKPCTGAQLIATITLLVCAR